MILGFFVSAEQKFINYKNEKLEVAIIKLVIQMTP